MEFRKRVKVTDQEIRLRAPKEMIKVIKIRAEENGRSRNAEILHRLVETLEKDKKR